MTPNKDQESTVQHSDTSAWQDHKSMSGEIDHVATPTRHDALSSRA